MVKLERQNSPNDSNSYKFNIIAKTINNNKKEIKTKKELDLLKSFQLTFEEASQNLGTIEKNITSESSQDLKEEQLNFESDFQNENVVKKHKSKIITGVILIIVAGAGIATTLIKKKNK